MHKVYKITGKPKSLYYDKKKGQGQLIISSGGEDLTIHVINDCDGKARSISEIWGYFNNGIPNNEKMTFTKFCSYHVNEQKTVSADIFSRRDKPIDAYINSNYKCLLNITSEKYYPILVNDVLRIFKKVLNNLGLQNDWKDEIINPTWEWTTGYIDFKDIQNIRCPAVQKNLNLAIQIKVLRK